MDRMDHRTDDRLVPDRLAGDRALVQAVLAHAPGAFERLVREYQGLVWHIVQRMVRHPDDTRELSQDTFLRVHQCLHQYRFESALKSWIGQVAYSVAKRHLERKRIALVEAIHDEDGHCLLDDIGDGFDLEAASSDAEIATGLHAEIEALPPLPRMLLTLYHLDEVPIGEIARITGLAEGTIKSHLFRSRAKLRERLQARMGAIA
jgi:RNA polymerase sigma factor (sigma-70 family)